MESFGRRNKSGGERSFGGGGGGGRSFGDGNRKPATLHRAVCGQCGVSCEVPFRPTGERPVLCKDCFKRNGDSFPKPSRFEEPKRFGSDRSERSERSESPSFASKGPDQTQKQLNAINAKLDKILEMLGEIEEDEED